MSISILAPSANIDYSSFRNKIDAKELVAPFYADIAGLEGVGWDFTTMTQSVLQSTHTSLKITNSSYAVDSNGFFGTDFNKAVGIPDNIKIHQSMYVQAEAYSQVQGENVDPLTVVSKVWKLFSTIAGNTLDPDKDGFITQKEIDAMPKSYISKGSLMDGIVSVQNTMQAMGDVISAASKVQTASNGTLDIGLRGFMADSAYSRVDTDPNIALYGHRESFEVYSGVAYDNNLPKDKIAVGELFDSFFYQKVDNETAGYLSTKNGAESCGTNVNATKEYYKYLQSGEDMQTYLTQTKGKDYLDQLKQLLFAPKGGAVDSDLANLFFQDIDEEQKALLAQYNANSYAELDSNNTSVTTPQIPTQTLMEQKNMASKNAQSTLCSILQKQQTASESKS